jgi:mannose/fructose/N-acetylgalactosamine-specific phosphotransferase system component IIC
MAIWQSLILALLGYMSSIYSPWLCGLLGGWYTLGRPLVAGMVIGLILGDVQQGIIIGAAIQALYIGLVTPGGAMPADVNFAAWIGIPLAMVSNAGTAFAVSLSVPLSFLGVAAVYSVVSINCLFVHKMDRYIESGDLHKAEMIPVVGQVTNFIARFFVIFICDYYGSQFLPKLVAAIPGWVNGILTLFGSMLPLVGFALLLNFVTKEKIHLVYYVIGFILVSVFKISIIPVAVIALLLAYMDIKYTSDKTTAKEGTYNEE